MDAGREIDALVAARVMGFEIVPEGLLPIEWLVGGVTKGIRIGELIHQVPLYSTNIAAAWEVVEVLWSRNLVVIVGGYISAGMGHVPWVCEINNGIKAPPEYAKEWRGQSETAPLAICKAALRAVGYDA